MSIESVETLLGVLRTTGLLAAEQVDEVARELGPHFDDPAALAEYLTEIDWLTDYQVRTVLAGDWGDLVFGPFHILQPLGEGARGRVFKAWDTRRGRVVALKVMRQPTAGGTLDARRRRDAMQALTRLAHPNVVRIFEADRVGEVDYFAMDPVEGVDLELHVQRTGRLSVEQAADCVRQAAQGLQHAHQAGLVHRDVQPGNLVLVRPPAGAAAGPRRGPEPLVKVLDWGLARVRPASEETPGPVADGEADAAPEGPPESSDYVAPEQAEDPHVIDPRADVYSLGCTFYFLLTGRPPFAGTPAAPKRVQPRQAEPEPLQRLRPDVPEELAGIVQRMVARRPEDRIPLPLLIVGPLRRFCPCRSSSNGTVLRPSSGGGRE
jgi:serine/threonine-protein kinase